LTRVIGIVPDTKTQAEHLNQIKKIWAEFKEDEYEEIIASMLRRLQAVIAAKGGRTKY
jgi:hypothetical protein